VTGTGDVASEAPTDRKACIVPLCSLEAEGPNNTTGVPAIDKSGERPYPKVAAGTVTPTYCTSCIVPLAALESYVPKDTTSGAPLIVDTSGEEVPAGKVADATVLSIAATSSLIAQALLEVEDPNITSGVTAADTGWEGSYPVTIGVHPSDNKHGEISLAIDITGVPRATGDSGNTTSVFPRCDFSASMPHSGLLRAALHS